MGQINVVVFILFSVLIKFLTLFKARDVIPLSNYFTHPFQPFFT